MIDSYQTTLLHDNELDTDPFDDPTESDIEEANAPFNLFDKDEKETILFVFNSFYLIVLITLQKKAKSDLKNNQF